MYFTVYDSRKKGICFLWDKTQGKKGSAEIGTCLLKYLKSLPGEIEHVVFYADTSDGQNRNQNVFAVLLYAVNTVGNIKKIDLKFMESGHSYMEADSIHATIERYRRHRNLYVPSEYKCLIEMCRKKPFLYEVYQIRFDDIYDLQDLSTKIVASRKKNVMGESVKWIHLKWLRFLRGENSVGYKYDVAVDNFEYINVNGKNILWESINIPKKYNTQHPVSMAKKRDLMNLIKKGVIPQDYFSFFDDLPSANGIRDQALWNLDDEEETFDEH